MNIIANGAPPSPTLLREQGAIDFRAGKPPLARNGDYCRGYELAGGVLPPGFVSNRPQPAPDRNDAIDLIRALKDGEIRLVSYVDREPPKALKERLIRALGGRP